MGAVVIVALALAASAVVLYRRRALLADREADRRWFAEEEAWWRALRES